MNESLFEKMRKAVYEYVFKRLDKTDNIIFSISDVYIVWSCKTLQNWKSCISTTLPDGMYYECTYNGDTNELYIDAYKKFDNICIKDFVTKEPKLNYKHVRQLNCKDNCSETCLNKCLGECDRIKNIEDK